MKKKASEKIASLWDLAVKSPFFVVAYAIIVVFLALLPGTGYYENLQQSFEPPLVRASEFDNFKPSLYPKKIGTEPAPIFSADAVGIIDMESGVPLYEFNPQARLRPASTTKLMTALLAVDYYSPDQIITVKRLAPVKKNEPESEMGLAVGDSLTVKNLLYGLLVPSGNDAAYAIADNYPGGIENFIYAMNEKAKQLHMKDTHFDNPTGVDSPTHYTTARDLSLLAREALKNKLISQIVATSGITLGDATGKKFYPMDNVNKLLGAIYGVDGVKTGYTDEAGQCIITSVSRDGHRILIVLLKSQNRFNETARLVEWVFRNFQWVNPSTGFGQ